MDLRAEDLHYKDYVKIYDKYLLNNKISILSLKLFIINN